jgi:hypothetical protein
VGPVIVSFSRFGTERQTTIIRIQSGLSNVHSLVNIKNFSHKSVRVSMRFLEAFVKRFISASFRVVQGMTDEQAGGGM